MCSQKYHDKYEEGKDTTLTRTRRIYIFDFLLIPLSIAERNPLQSISEGKMEGEDKA